MAVFISNFAAPNIHLGICRIESHCDSSLNGNTFSILNPTLPQSLFKTMNQYYLTLDSNQKERQKTKSKGNFKSIETEQQRSQAEWLASRS